MTKRWGTKAIVKEKVVLSKSHEPERLTPRLARNSSEMTENLKALERLRMLRFSYRISKRQ